MKIGVFDSGIGGISVLNELKKTLDADFIYLADTEFVPYGDKPVSVIRERTVKCVEFLSSQQIDILVIACNTITLTVLDFLKEYFTAIPIIGMTPVINKALKLTKSGNIGVLATVATINSHAFMQAIAGKNVTAVACPGLVEYVEQGQLHSERMISLLYGYLQSILKDDCDILVLGCTHYHFLRNTIKKLIPGTDIQLLDSTYEVIQELKHMNVQVLNTRQQQIEYYCTANVELVNKQLTWYVDAGAHAMQVCV